MSEVFLKKADYTVSNTVDLYNTYEYSNCCGAHGSAGNSSSSSTPLKRENTAAASVRMVCLAFTISELQHANES